MLVVIAGATGNIGQKLIDSFLSRGHSVRVLARNPSSIPASKRSFLERIITFSTYYDTVALDRACEGVDAVVCAYSGIPELQLEGQLLLLRAAERAGVKRFLSASWNYDWSEMTLGQQESYDPYISFRRQVEITSDIRPVYIFCGVLAEVLFSFPGHGDFSPANHGVWDPAAKTMEIWGTGDEKWQWTTERDAAEFAAEILQRDDAVDGGFWRVCSGSHTLREMASTYAKVKSTQVEVLMKGSVDELRARALEARAQGSPRSFWFYIGWFYQLHTVDQTWTLRTLDNDRLDVAETSFEDFLRSSDAI